MYWGKPRKRKRKPFRVRRDANRSRRGFGYWIGRQHFKATYKKPLILKKISLRDSMNVDIRKISLLRVKYWLVHNLIIIEILEGKTIVEILKERSIGLRDWYRFHEFICKGYYKKDLDEALKLRTLIRRDKQRLESEELL